MVFASIDISFDRQLRAILEEDDLNAIHQNIRCGTLTPKQWQTIIRIIRKKVIKELVITTGKEESSHQWRSNRQHGKTIGRILYRNKGLECISLRKMHIGDSGAKGIGRGISNNSCLRVLKLWNANIGDDGTIAIVQGILNGNAPIDELSLVGNHIGDAGAIAISSLLTCNSNRESSKSGSRCPLKRLNLSSNMIRNKGIAAISKELQRNESLETLTIGHNTIEDDGVSALSVAVAHHPRLKRLYCDNCGMGRAGLESIINAMHSNTSLLHLNMLGNALDPDADDSLLDMLRHNHTLTTLVFKEFEFPQLPSATLEKIDGILSNNKQGIPLVHKLMENIPPSLYPIAIARIRNRWHINTMFEVVKGHNEIFQSFNQSQR